MRYEILIFVYESRLTEWRDFNEQLNQVKSFLIGKALFLTPLIKAGKIKEAQHAAKVELLGQDVKSYSGYLTVGQENCGSNLFFWFFPAMVDI